MIVERTDLFIDEFVNIRSEQLDCLETKNRPKAMNLAPVKFGGTASSNLRMLGPKPVPYHLATSTIARTMTIIARQQKNPHPDII